MFQNDREFISLFFSIIVFGGKGKDFLQRIKAIARILCGETAGYSRHERHE